MREDKFKEKIETLQELDRFQESLLEKRRKSGLSFREISVRLSNGNIYVEVIADKEEFGRDVLDSINTAEYEHLTKVKLQTYSSRDRVKCIYVIYDYQQKKFKFKNTAKVTKIEDISKYDMLPTP